MKPLRLFMSLAILAPIAACAAEGAATETPVSFDTISPDQARDMPAAGPFAQGRTGPGGGTILAPASAPIEHGIPYRFNLGHCGLHSPVDVDGSFWDPLDSVTGTGEPLDLRNGGEMINATVGVIVVIGDEARFRTEMGSVVRFERHLSDKEVPGCD